MHNVYICVGSNVGQRRINCQKGLEFIEKFYDCSIQAQSALYLTEPVDYKNQNWFINVLALIKTDLEPFELLKVFKTIEEKFGRNMDERRFGPRIIDIDILLYDNLILNTPELIIPHPRMHKRLFVLKPFCDINPNIIHPVLNRSIKELLKELDTNGEKVILADAA
ncbi:MAG: 2-amino-4-hydroxy-6-hydroxymethyldihydropteridine diphosphokinase [Desulfobacterales bacterium]|nr:2-amino-4-hydroxy-6-hydroxymethyldihydropteridine diphosphokinase [Desulfobacterales bacterium]